MDNRLPSWHLQAQCRGIDSEVFHPRRGDDRAARAAIEICQGCSVQASCLSWALEVELGDGQHRPTREGIYGGTIPAERTGLWKGTHRQCSNCQRVRPAEQECCGAKGSTAA